MVGVDQSGLVPLSAGAGKLHIPKGFSGVTSSSLPGIRALRATGGSHGNPASSSAEGTSSGGKASSRGRDAMALLDRRRREGGYPMAAALEQADTVDVQEITEMLQGVALQQSEREILQGDSERHPQAASSTAAPQAESDLRNQPWRKPRFQRIERSSRDKWNLELLEEGWYVREHHQYRVQRFHPIHSSTPFDSSTIESRRITVKVKPTHVIEEDAWTIPNRDKAEAWMGYTFFKRANMPPSDDSFELIGS